MADRNLERRQFLRMASAGALAQALRPSPASAKGPDGPQVQTHVLIIGAGMSGISTAFWLRSHGITSIVLEAQGRLGGRILSSRVWPDAILDLGAAWIHDSPNSPLTPLAQRMGVKTFDTDVLNFTMSTPNGHVLNDAEVAAVLGGYAALVGSVEADSLQRQAQGLPDISLGSEIAQVLRQLKLPPGELAGVQTLIDANWGTHYGVNLNKMSLYQLDADQNVLGNHDLAFPKGYVQLVEGLAANLDVRYGQRVQHVLYGQDGVTVLTNQGKFTAQCAVVTLPIGVLRKGTVDFRPALPARKQQAIDRLNMGTVDKVVLRFPTAFWDTTKTFLFRNSPEQGRFVFWFNTVPLVGQPILLCLIDGDFAVKVERMSDADVVSALMDVLHQWYGPGIPNPTGFQRSMWGANPYSYGSYTYLGVGETGADYDIMSLPVPYAPGLPESANRLFFAGDATHREHPTSVWGAFESGKREAQRIANMLLGVS